MAQGPAVDLAARGCHYDTISGEVGYRNPSTAHRTVMNALREHTANAVEDLREAELERRDALKEAPWCGAQGSADRAQDHGHRAHLLGPEQRGGTAPREVHQRVVPDGD